MLEGFRQNNEITKMPPAPDTHNTTWSDDVYQVLRSRHVQLICTVPDAGLTDILNKCHSDTSMTVLTLTTEEEGIGIVTGAWLGGMRAVLLMQSSGTGNCINALSLPQNCQTPCPMLVTMRGEWGEFNPWQVPMGSNVEPIFTHMGVQCFRATKKSQVGALFAGSLDLAYNSTTRTAVLIDQQVVGAKDFAK